MNKLIQPLRTLRFKEVKDLPVVILPGGGGEKLESWLSDCSVGFAFCPASLTKGTRGHCLLGSGCWKKQVAGVRTGQSQGPELQL